MHPLRQFLTVVLLLAFVSGAADVSVFARMWTAPKQGTKPSSCPMHALKCCCPEVCNAPKKAAIKLGCHESKAKSASLPAPTCFLKAACGRQDAVAFAISTLKDFILEPVRQLDLPREILPFCVSLESHVLFGHLPLPFHPPRNS
jgi:hypothetical protein